MKQILKDLQDRLRAKAEEQKTIADASVHSDDKLIALARSLSYRDAVVIVMEAEMALQAAEMGVTL